MPNVVGGGEQPPDKFAIIFSKLMVLKLALKLALKTAPSSEAAGDIRSLLTSIKPPSCLLLVLQLAPSSLPHPWLLRALGWNDLSYRLN